MHFCTPKYVEVFLAPSNAQGMENPGVLRQVLGVFSALDSGDSLPVFNAYYIQQAYISPNSRLPFYSFHGN